MKINKMIACLLFIPNLLRPTGLYLAGDKNILSIKTEDEISRDFHVSDDKEGHCIIANENGANPFFIYVNKNMKEFKERLNPPADQSITEKYNLTALTDMKLLRIMHYLLTTEMKNRKYKIHHTMHILKLVDEALSLRVGEESRFNAPRDKLMKIKNEIDELIIAKEIKIEKSKNSLIPVRIDENNSSDSD